MKDLSPNTFASVSAVTFDIGGTLLAPFPSVGAVYAEVFARHGIASDPGKIESAFRRAWKKFALGGPGPTNEEREVTKWRRIVAATIEGPDPPENFDALFDGLWQTFSEPRRWRIRDEAGEVLSNLRARGFRLAVLSNWDSRLRPLLNGLGLADHFEAFFISSEIGWEKPHPRIFHSAASRMDLPPARILHVGDSPQHDVAPARNAGWNAVLIHPENAPQSPASPDAPRRNDSPSITSLRELVLLI